MNKQHKAAVALSSTQAQLVYFSTQLCGPCKIQKPMMHRLKAAYGLSMLEQDAAQWSAEDLASMGIRAVPHIQVIVMGKVTANIVGARSESEMKRLLTQANVITDGLDFE